MSDNPFDLSNDGDDEGSGVGDNVTIQELRKAYQRQEKAVKAADKELSELREFKAKVVAEQRETAITAAFTEVGLNPAHAKLYRAMNPDLEVESITAESVAGFAAEYSLPTETTGTVPDAPEPAKSGYRPVTTGSAAPLARLTQEDIDRLMREGDFETVNKAYAEGRVEKESVPWRQV